MEQLSVSLKLYILLNQNIVGSEKYVRTVRKILAIKDRLISAGENTWSYITSGSRGEGLDIGGSDLDIMFVDKFISVSETEPTYFRPEMSYFRAEPDNVKLGFVHLRLIHSNNANVFELCDFFENDYFLSNILFKEAIMHKLNEINAKIHGPCCSDEDGAMDYARCVHNPKFCSYAMQWVYRPNNGWPSDDIKQHIIKHGILFVPVGLKGSKNEEFEWRTSFSVAEKFLINSLNQTQLASYVLMKIILKDVINHHPPSKGLLCSYFIKTIFFWVLESTHPDEWRPWNLLRCFMECFKRLIYCVKYVNCPHYFIPEINLFETKITDAAQAQLLQTLWEEYSYGWQCVFFASRIRRKYFNIPNGDSEFLTDMNKLILTPYVLSPLLNIPDNDRCYQCAIKLAHIYKSPSIRKIILQCISDISRNIVNNKVVIGLFGNTFYYKEYKKDQGYLLQGVQYGAVTGWIYLVLFYLNMKHYYKALYILEHCHIHCSWEKLHCGSRLIPDNKVAINSLSCISKNMFTVLKFLFTDYVILHPAMPSCPREVYVEFNYSQFHPTVHLHPRVCIYFLSFLCHYHTRNTTECQTIIKELQYFTSESFFCDDPGVISRIKSGQRTLTIKRIISNIPFTVMPNLIRQNLNLILGRHFLDRPDILSSVYFCLGVAYQLLDEINSAISCFEQSIETHPDRYNPSFIRLSKLTH